MKVGKVIGIAVVAAGLGGLGFVIYGRIQEVQTARANEKVVPLPPPVVIVAGVGPHDFTETLEVSGELHAARTVQVVPKLGGRILELPIALGQTVKAGDTVAKLEPNDLEWRAKQAHAGERAAQAAVRMASVQLEIARTEVARAEKLHTQNAIPESDLVRARGGRDAAEAQVGAARAQVEVARATAGLADEAVTWTVVTAPLDGVITRRWTELAAMAGTTTPIVEIQDQSTLRLEVDVPARALSALTLGSEVKFHVEELGVERVFKASVKAVGKSLDPQTRRTRVELEVPGVLVGEGVLPAMLATVEITLSAKSGVLAAPRGAVINLADGPAVFAVRDGVAKRLKVAPADGDKTHVPLGEDAKATDLVVVQGQDGLLDGAKVEVEKGKGATP